METRSAGGGAREESESIKIPTGASDSHFITHSSWREVGWTFCLTEDLRGNKPYKVTGTQRLTHA